jgi:hypothetical protein
MQNKYLLILILCLTGISVNAQSVLKGIVYENGTNNRVPDVFVRDNNNNKQMTLTDKDGNFSIKTEPGHIIIFDSPGYISDTLYLVDLTQIKIMLTTQTIALREVSINSTRATFDPHKEYPDVYTKSKVYVMSPSTWFSQEGKDARRLKKYFQREQEERHIDAVFTRAYVGSIIPLKGPELENFMTLYRPTYAFVMNNNGPSMASYINDSYKKYQTLPPEKRTLQKLNDTTAMKK